MSIENTSPMRMSVEERRWIYDAVIAHPKNDEDRPKGCVWNRFVPTTLRHSGNGGNTFRNSAAANNIPVPTNVPTDKSEWEQAFLTEEQTAKVLEIRVFCLREWRLREEGPRWRESNGRIQYGRSDIESFITGCPEYVEFKLPRADS